MKYSKVTDHPHLLRDNTTSAILNTDQNAYQEYLNRSQTHKIEKDKIESLERDMGTIKDEISQVKNLIQELLNATK